VGGPRLGRRFFDRPTRTVGRDLLGRELHVRSAGGARSVRLVEVEVYIARDPASHAYRGPTKRNRSMFAGPGTLYVYRIHQVVCANLSTRPGEAVLLRAGAPLDGDPGNPSGPGRLCRYLGLAHADDGTDVTKSRRIFRTAGAGRRRDESLLASPRVGISRATERRLRYSVEGDPWVSRPHPRRELT
jgi:DNA-3-methyladenine glycosylase